MVRDIRGELTITNQPKKLNYDPLNLNLQRQIPLEATMDPDPIQNRIHNLDFNENEMNLKIMN